MLLFALILSIIIQLSNGNNMTQCVYAADGVEILQCNLCSAEGTEFSVENGCIECFDDGAYSVMTILFILSISVISAMIVLFHASMTYRMLSIWSWLQIAAIVFYRGSAAFSPVHKQHGFIVTIIMFPATLWKSHCDEITAWNQATSFGIVILEIFSIFFIFWSSTHLHHFCRHSNLHKNHNLNHFMKILSEFERRWQYEGNEKPNNDQLDDDGVEEEEDGDFVNIYNDHDNRPHPMKQSPTITPKTTTNTTQQRPPQKGTHLKVSEIPSIFKSISINSNVNLSQIDSKSSENMSAAKPEELETEIPGNPEQKEKIIKITTPQTSMLDHSHLNLESTTSTKSVNLVPNESMIQSEDLKNFELKIPKPLHVHSSHSSTTLREKGGGGRLPTVDEVAPDTEIKNSVQSYNSSPPKDLNQVYLADDIEGNTNGQMRRSQSSLSVLSQISNVIQYDLQSPLSDQMVISQQPQIKHNKNNNNKVLKDEKAFEYPLNNDPNEALCEDTYYYMIEMVNNEEPSSQFIQSKKRDYPPNVRTDEVSQLNVPKKFIEHSSNISVPTMPSLPIESMQNESNISIPGHPSVPQLNINKFDDDKEEEIIINDDDNRSQQSLELQD